MPIENGGIEHDAELIPQISSNFNGELETAAAESGIAAPALHKLFRIFLVFADADETSSPIEEEEEEEVEDGISPESSSSSRAKHGSTITADEVLLLCGMAFEALDWSRPYSMEKLDECRSKLEQQLGSDQLVKFKEFLNLFPSLVSVSSQVYHDVVSALYEQIVVQVIRKGRLMRRRYRPGNPLPFISRWKRTMCFVLPGRLLSHTIRRRSHPKSKEFRLTGNNLQEKTGFLKSFDWLNGGSPSTAAQKNSHRTTNKQLFDCFRLKFGDAGRVYEFGAESTLEKFRWIEAIKAAADFSSNSVGVAHANFVRDSFRGSHRASSLFGKPALTNCTRISISGGGGDTSDEFCTQHTNLIEDLKTDVAKLQFQLKQRDADLAMEIAKVKDLIRQNESLKDQLRSEQRAVKDEEIVRAATARMLDQEQKRREDLEESLGSERKKRENVERLVSTREAELIALKRQLEEITATTRQHHRNGILVKGTETSPLVTYRRGSGTGGTSASGDESETDERREKIEQLKQMQNNLLKQQRSLKADLASENRRSQEVIESERSKLAQLLDGKGAKTSPGQQWPRSGFTQPPHPSPDSGFSSSN